MSETVDLKCMVAQLQQQTEILLRIELAVRKDEFEQQHIDQENKQARKRLLSMVSDFKKSHKKRKEITEERHTRKETK